MTQRRKKRRSRFGRRAFLAGAGCAALAGVGLMLRRGQTVSALSVPAPEAEPNAALPAGEWRAVWVSYLEWAGMDFSSEEAFRAGAAGPDGQLPVHRAEHRHRAGAALRGCPLPQQTLPVEPCLHRGAGERPRLRPAGRPHHRGPQPGAFAGSVGQPLPSPFLGEDARRAGRKQPRQHPSRVGLRRGRGAVPESGPPRGGGLCGAGRGRAGAELCRGRHPLRRLFLSHHRPGAGRGPVRLQRRGELGRMAAAECHGAGQGGPRRRESRRCHPPLRGQPAGQPRQRSSRSSTATSGHG